MWRWTYVLRARLRALMSRERDDRELQDELTFHIAIQARANERRGMDARQAERSARIDLGGAQQLKETLHEQRSLPWLDHVGQDVRYALRTILRTKVASLAVIVTFALGVGANAAMVSLIDGKGSIVELSESFSQSIDNQQSTTIQQSQSIKSAIVD